MNIYPARPTSMAPHAPRTIETTHRVDADVCHQRSVDSLIRDVRIPVRRATADDGLPS
jgi:hypothetical protein